MQKKLAFKSWIIVDHPQHLATAIMVSRICKSKFGTKSNLIVSRHAYWEGVSFNEYKGEFAKVKWFERLDYPPPSLNIYYQLAASVLLIPKLYNLSNFVKNLGIGEDDIIIGLSTQQFLENKVLSYYKKNKKIGIVVSYVYANSKRNTYKRGFHYSLATFIVKQFQLLFGMYEVVCKYRWSNGKVLDGGTVQKYKEPLTKIYDYLLVMENAIEPIRTGPKSLNTNLIKTKYPYTYTLGSMNKSMRKSVVFLGEDFLSANNIDHKIHAALVNKCLDFLRENYGKECELIYKPHPRWNKELEVLDLTAFKIYKDHDPAELYFIKNSKNIKAVFSVISTASRSAINCCLPSYMFYKTFPFAKSVLKEWGNLLGKMPSESFITNLDKKPGQIKVKDWSKSHQVFSDHLVFAIKDLIGKI